jgi:hypothetical protein
MKENRMGETRGTHGEKKNAGRDLVGKHEGKGDLEDRGVRGRIILKLYRRNVMSSCVVDRSAGDADKWRAAVCTVMSFWVSWNG